MIKLHVKVKFRAFFIDFGVVDETVDVTLIVRKLFNLPLTIALPRVVTTLYNNKGVLVEMLA